MAVLSGREAHAYASAQGVRALGKNVLLITDSPQLQEMAYSDGIIHISPEDNLENLLSKLESFELDGVLVSADTDLLPIQHQIATRFNLRSVGEESGKFGNDKFAWREALAKGNVPQPYFSTNPLDFENEACVRKPRTGCSSKGVKLLKPADDKTAYAGPEFFFEAIVPGYQYNYEGIVRDGEVHILARMFDQYREHNGAVVPHYYLLNPPINPDREAALAKCTKLSLKASNIVNGAYHLEMRMQDDLAVPIDFANRIGTSERTVSFSIGGNLGKAHASCFLKSGSTFELGEPKQMMQYWCWTEEEFECAQKLLEQYPNWVFDARMKPHEMNGETSFGTFTVFHDDFEGIKEMASTLDLKLSF